MNEEGSTAREQEAADALATSEHTTVDGRALLAHVRHELRTPLNAIIGYSELLLEDSQEAGHSDFVPDLQKIREAGRLLLAVIDQALTPAAGEARLSVDSDGLGSTVRHDLRTPLNAIIGYSELLLEDAQNRGLDALVPELQKIHGAGQDLLDRIDDLFRFTVDAAGGVEVRDFSTADARDAVSAIQSLEEREPREASAVKGSVLVVDDNAVNRDLLSRRLVRHGHRVTTVEDGRRALQLLQTHSFDLVLLDIMMPEMNGYQVLQRLKADEKLRHIPVIMISALDEIDSVVRCIHLGAEDYLAKPFDPVLLRARIGACLEKKLLRDREAQHLAQIEAEKQRADELLHVILPHQIVTELKATNAVKPRRYDNVAVLFCDIVDFTRYCEALPAEEVIANLQGLVHSYEELMLKYEMQKIKTNGDSFMATAGLLDKVENPALNCVQCGHEMIELAHSLPARWEVRVGIHVGSVMAGVVGHRQYLFDLWGDTVNTAARAEAHGLAGSVNVSAAVWRCVEDSCAGESLGMMDVKGKGMMELFRVGGPRSDVESA